MEVNIKLEIEDWYKFQTYLFNKFSKELNTRKRFWKDVWQWTILALVFILIFNIWDPFSSPNSSFSWPTAIIVLFLITLLTAIHIVNSKKLREAFEPSLEGAFGCAQKYSFNDKGFVIEAEGYRCEIVWPFIMHIEREHGYIMLYIDTAQAYVLPVKQLVNPDGVYDYILEKYEAALEG